jgi:phosphatidylglycerophosphate synthase
VPEYVFSGDEFEDAIIFPEKKLAEVADALHDESSHQRPEGVLGEWELVPEDERNVHQRVAAATGGWLSVANVVSVAGGVIAAKGIVDFARGRRMLGVAEVGVGRVLDLADGAVSKRLGTRSKPGAFTDAGVDKVLAGVAMVTLPMTERTISPLYAAATTVEQARIAWINTQIKRAGGEPTPNGSGKAGAAATWAAVVTRMVESILKEKGRKGSARVVGAVALAAEAVSLALSEQAIAGYRQQEKSVRG